MLMGFFLVTLRLRLGGLVIRALDLDLLEVILQGQFLLGQGHARRQP